MLNIIAVNKIGEQVLRSAADKLIGILMFVVMMPVVFVFCVLMAFWIVAENFVAWFKKNIARNGES